MKRFNHYIKSSFEFVRRFLQTFKCRRFNKNYRKSRENVFEQLDITETNNSE